MSPSGAAICRCEDGYSHLPGQSTIDGCPTRIRNERPQNTSPNRFRPQRPVNQPPRQIIQAGDPCQPSPCGTNAECSVSGKTIKSLSGYVLVSCGTPLIVYK